jgi:hypothetical protein
VELLDFNQLNRISKEHKSELLDALSSSEFEGLFMEMILIFQWQELHL